MPSLLPFVFFFQAEDGIRDLTVTGVQTCALPISPRGSRPRHGAPASRGLLGSERRPQHVAERPDGVDVGATLAAGGRVLGRGAGCPRFRRRAPRARAGGSRAPAGAGLRLAVHHLDGGGGRLCRAPLHPALRRRGAPDQSAFRRRSRGRGSAGRRTRTPRRPVPQRAGPSGRGARPLRRMRSIVIHGHFYQPPRDDPWLGAIPREASAAPYHDWNERIERESYAPVAASLASMSFDFGPTLLAWMERHAAATYGAVLAADRAGVAVHAGHGNAIAMPYHHTILPLSSRRDKETEVRWGIGDFRRRFGREPEGMWLPETAVDDETLDVLAAEGILFTILAPHQVERVPAGGRPRRRRTAAGRPPALFLLYSPLSPHGPLPPPVGGPAA